MRNIHPDTLTKLKTDHLRALLVRFDYTPVPVMITNAPVDIQYQGETYLANTSLKSLGKIKQSIDIRVSSTSIVMDAVDPSMVAILLSNAQHARKVEIFVVILNDDYSIAGEPISMNSMVIEGTPKIKDDPKKGVATITQQISSEFANWKYKGGRSTTPSSQHRYFPTDTGFNFAAEAGKQYPWGRKK